MGHEGINQGASFIPGTGVDDQPRCFVYDQQIVVLVDNHERNFLGGGKGWRGGGNADLNPFAALQSVTSAGYDSSLDSDAAFRNKIFETRAADGWKGPGQKTVETRTGGGYRGKRLKG